MELLRNKTRLGSIIRRTIVLSCMLLWHTLYAQTTYDITHFGASGNGKTINTRAIQKTIDKAHASGGGMVVVPPGQWMTGKLFLRSNIVLYISPGAILLAAPGPIYGEPKGSIPALIYGKELEQISITGGGVIEGKTGITRERGEGLGRRLVGLERCRNVKITNITLTHGGGCTMLLQSLDSLEIGDVKLLSFFSKDPNGGGDGKDGVNLDGSRNVWVHDSEFRGSDDAFAFKARESGFLTTSENIKVERCVFASRSSNAIQFGSETNSDFRNIEVTDCRVEHSGKAGIGITMNDGHIIENITFRNITLRNTCTPIYLSITNRKGIGTIRNITFENIKAVDIFQIEEYSKRSPHGYWVAAVNGLKESMIENLVFKDFEANYKGGITQKAENIWPPDPVRDYQPRQMGMRPASGFYLRHAENVRFENVRISVQAPDARPAMVLDDVDGLSITRAELPYSAEAACHLLLRGCKRIQADTSLKISEVPLRVLLVPFAVDKTKRFFKELDAIDHYNLRFWGKYAEEGTRNSLSLQEQVLQSKQFIDVASALGFDNYIFFTKRTFEPALSYDFEVPGIGNVGKAAGIKPQLEIRKGIEEVIDHAKNKGMKVYWHSNQFMFPDGIVKLAGSVNTENVSELIWQIYRCKIKEFVTLFPGIAGVQITGDETDYGVTNRSGLDRLANETAAAVGPDRVVLMRTWQRINGLGDPRTMADKVLPNIFFSLKNTSGDFYSFGKSSPMDTVYVGQVPGRQVVEFDAWSEFEGHNIFPMYKGDIFASRFRRIADLGVKRIGIRFNWESSGWFAITDNPYGNWVNIYSFVKLAQNPYRNPLEILKAYVEEYFPAEARDAAIDFYRYASPKYVESIFYNNGEYLAEHSRIPYGKKVKPGGLNETWFMHVDSAYADVMRSINALPESAADFKIKMTKGALIFAYLSKSFALAKGVRGDYGFLREWRELDIKSFRTLNADRLLQTLESR